MKERNRLMEFLTKRGNDNLKTQYYDSSDDVQEMLERIYAIAYRYALTDTQTEYLLQEAALPFQKNVCDYLAEVFND